MLRGSCVRNCRFRYLIVKVSSTVFSKGVHGTNVDVLTDFDGNAVVAPTGLIKGRRAIAPLAVLGVCGRSPADALRTLPGLLERFPAGAVAKVSPLPRPSKTTCCCLRPFRLLKQNAMGGVGLINNRQLRPQGLEGRQQCVL